MHFRVWTNERSDGALAWIDRPPDEIVQTYWKITRGRASSDWFPPDLAFPIDPNEGTRLADSIPNVLALHFVSQKLRHVLEAESAARLEFLPIRVKDKKGRIGKEPYFVANFLDLIPCMDPARSQYRMGSITPDQVERMKLLVLDDAKVPPDAKIFRLGEMTELVLVREDLADSILRQGCTGVAFQDLESYGAEFRR